MSVRVAERSTQAIRQGVKFSLPSAKDPPRDVAADTVLGKVRHSAPRLSLSLSLTHPHKLTAHLLHST